jgi:hypothetical protein
MARPGGNPKFIEIRNSDTSAANRRRDFLADEHASKIAHALKATFSISGSHSFGWYADWLNEEGYRTRRGYLWTGRQVSRFFKRIGRTGFKLAPETTEG